MGTDKGTDAYKVGLMELVEQAKQLIECKDEQCLTDYSIYGILNEMTELVKPVLPAKKDENHWYCGDCGKRLIFKSKQRYCYKCGRRIAKDAPKQG